MKKKFGPSKPRIRKKPPGTPRKADVSHSYSPEDKRAIALMICERIANGETLEDICKSPGMPTPQTVWNWRNADVVIFESYARSQDARAERHADNLVHRVLSAKPKNAVQVALLRVQVDTLKWVASKLLHKRYGERLEVGGSLSHKIISPDIVLDTVRTMSPVLGALMAKQGKN